MNIEKLINKEVRFQWEETASAWGGAKKMTTETFEAVTEDIDNQETIDYINWEIRRRFNKACDQYLIFLNNLGPRY